MRKTVDLLGKMQLENNIKAELTNTLQLANLVFLHHSQLMDTLANIMLNNQNANLIEIIDEETLFINLKTIEKKVGKEYAFPIPLSNETLAELLQFCEIRIKIIGTIIHIYIAIPIVFKEQFDHYRLILSPFRVDREMFMYEGVFGHIMMNARRDKYLLVTDGQMVNCRGIDEKNGVCSGLSPIFMGPSCEFDFITTNNTHDCPTQRIPNGCYVNQISVDTFVIIPFNETDIVIQCPEKLPYNHTVGSALKLIIEPGCTFSNENFRYEIDGEFTTNISISVSGSTGFNFTFQDNLTDYRDSTISLQHWMVWDWNLPT